MKLILLIPIFFAVTTFAQRTPQRQCDSVIHVTNVQAKTIDSLKTKLFLANYRVEKVRFYLNICTRRPSQTKYLKGWIRRAIN